MKFCPAFGSRSALLTLLLFATASCEDDGTTTPPLASAFIGPAGGTLQVADGPYAGLRLDVPADAVTSPTEFTFTEIVGAAVPGFRNVGNAISLAPAGVTFQLPLELTMPLPGQVAAGSDVALLVQDRDGSGSGPGNTPIELGPPTTAIGGAIDTVTVPVLSAGTYWPAQRLFGGDPTADFLPVADGNEWIFEGGLTATMVESDMEPNLDGETVVRLTFQTMERDLGFYLQLGNEGAILSRGTFSTTDDPNTSESESFQLLHDALDLVPAQLTLGQPREILGLYDGYRGFGSNEISESGNARLGPTGNRLPEVTVPLGTFPTVLVLDLPQAFLPVDLAPPPGPGEPGVGDDPPAPTDIALRLTLARDVGLVGVRIFGRDWALAEGTVGGEPIEPPED